jgi:hypothetical protein
MQDGIPAFGDYQEFQSFTIRVPRQATFLPYLSVPLQVICASPRPHTLNMNPLVLTVRGLLKSAEEKATNRICPIENHTGPAIIPFVGSLTYHRFSTILAGACAVLSTLIVLVLIALHATNYSNPVQQRQIIRVALLVPYVSFFSFLIVWLHASGEYLVESLDFGCAIALSAFLLFMCDLILSHPGGFEQLFGQSMGESKKKSPQSLRVRLHIHF